MIEKISHTPVDLSRSNIIIGSKKQVNMPKAMIEDHGQILTANCPECKKRTGYTLIRQTFPAPVFFKIFISDTYLWHIECMDCKHIVKVPLHEAEMIPEVKVMGEKMAAGEISPEDFYRVFGQFSFVVDLLNQEHSWECPICTEKVDWKFQVCWNCSAPNPDIGSDESSPETPKFVQPSCGFNVIQQ